MQARWAAALLLAAALAVAGPGTSTLHAGEAPSERGRPSDRPSQGGGPQDTPPGGPQDTPPGQASENDAGSAERSSGRTDGGASPGGPSDPSGGTSQPTLTGPPQPPPLPEPNLTGTRVLRSSLGPAHREDSGSMMLRDLQVVVTETQAAGIDGGWWVLVTAPDGDLTVSPPTLKAAGNGGVPRAPDARARGGGPLFSVTGQRSRRRYGGSYEARGSVGIPAGDAADRPVVTVLLIQ